MGISRGRPPTMRTALYDWMRRRGVTVDDLAPKLHCTPQWLSKIRTGAASPDDELKVLIANVTRTMEAEAGVKRPLGVRVRTWFPEGVW